MRHDHIIGVWSFLVAIALFSQAAGCSSPANPAAAPKARSDSRTIVISAAASTKEPIEELARRFEESAKVKVQVNLGPSSGLATQIIEGAPADLFLSANEQWADELARHDLVGERVSLLTNRLAIVVPKGNPAGVEKPEDLLGEEVSKIALAGEKVPAGQYADQALTGLDLLVKLTEAGKIARGQDVRSALAYVERGEAEAGIVYTTDAAAAEQVEIAYEFDPAMHDKIVYVLVLVARDGKPAGSSASKAADFYAFLQSDTATAEFAKRGFLKLP